PSRALPSSQNSPGSSLPSPQRIVDVQRPFASHSKKGSTAQAPLQPSPGNVLPSSQSSSRSRRPSPQAGPASANTSFGSAAPASCCSTVTPCMPPSWPYPDDSIATVPPSWSPSGKELGAEGSVRSTTGASTHPTNAPSPQTAHSPNRPLEITTPLA